jgi:glutathione S-transferase
MFSTNAVAALGNLHIGAIPVRNVSEDPAALADLEAIADKGQAPCLVVGNRAMHEAADIMRYFADRTTDIGG